MTPDQQKRMYQRCDEVSQGDIFNGPGKVPSFYDGYKCAVEEAETLVRALRFYANSQNWKKKAPDVASVAESDGGAVAVENIERWFED